MTKPLLIVTHPILPGGSPSNLKYFGRGGYHPAGSRGYPALSRPIPPHPAGIMLGKKPVNCGGQDYDIFDVQALEAPMTEMPGEDLNEFVERLRRMEKAENEERLMRQVLFDDETPSVVQVHALEEVLDRSDRNRERETGPTLPDPERPSKPLITPSQRTIDPFTPERIAEIKSRLTIGKDLTGEQRQQVEDLISEFADVFALSLSEVLLVDLTELRFDIPEGTEFPKKAGQRKLTKPQKVTLYHTLNELESAGIIERVSQDQVKAVSPINMVPKQSSAPFPVKYPEEGVYSKEEDKPDEQQAKWRLVQNFASVNKVAQIRPFPMGDLAAKQRWAAGKRMPFGLTGAPTTFCEMLAMALHDLIGVHMEVWMDNIASASDDFGSALGSLRLIFERCRTHRLSLSPAKSVLFMSEATFASARVSKEGVWPDLHKVRAILEWPEPKSVLEVMGFLSLVGSYHTKIKNFARIAQPLSNLTRDVKVELNGRGGRHSYWAALREQEVVHTDETRQAFLELKLALTLDPVIRAPVYDGRPFIVSTDGSKFGFGAVLEREWVEVDHKGVEQKVRYPIAYASKRTSRSEERYIPFLLEFAAMKYATDEFDDLIFGQPVEFETDCKALVDLLGNNKLNSTHERWRESIIARDIRAVRHVPGANNTACDALSRVYEH
ncbi:hypothetical protein FRC09_001116 [Ceratobasidium sp. 395]|nr:hypothetical protein FRC09_001116 [Ceratobasidium sp. 395]